MTTLPTTARELPKPLTDEQERLIDESIIESVRTGSLTYTPGTQPQQGIESSTVIDALIEWPTVARAAIQMLPIGRDRWRLQNSIDRLASLSYALCAARDERRENPPTVRHDTPQMQKLVGDFLAGNGDDGQPDAFDLDEGNHGPNLR